MLDPWDEDDPNPWLSISDGSFTTTNEGPDLWLPSSLKGLLLAGFGIEQDCAKARKIYADSCR